MTDTILVLTEDTLASADVAHILSLHEGETLAYRVLVPADTERNVLVSLVDQLSLGELRDALDTVLGREPRPTEAVADAAEQLADSLAAFAEAGVRVPEDVAVVGFDDEPGAEFYAPPLTTVRQDFAELGRRAVAALVEAMGGRVPEVASIAPELVVRASSGSGRDV